MATVKAPKPLIQAASIATAIDKVTGKILGFAVKSNSSNDYYQVTFLEIAGQYEFFCTCISAEYAFHNCKNGHCCHIEAVIQVLLAKAEMENQDVAEAIAEAEELMKVASVQAEQGETPAQVVTSAMLDATEVQIVQIAEKKSTPIIAAPTFTNRGFRLEAVPELNGRMVPLKAS